MRAAGVTMKGSSYDVINNITGQIVLQLDKEEADAEASCPQVKA